MHKAKIKAGIENIDTDREINPPKAFEKKNQLFFSGGIINKRDGIIYVNFTGKFLIRPMDVIVAIFIVYNWTTNAILATTVKNMKEETIIECFKTNISYLTNRVLKPVLNIKENVDSKAVQTQPFKKMWGSNWWSLTIIE